MKEYYKWAATGCFYCVTYHKNGRIKEVVVAENKDEKRIRYVKGKDFSRAFLKRCESVDEDGFGDVYNDVASLIMVAI